MWQNEWVKMGMNCGDGGSGRGISGKRRREHEIFFRDLDRQEEGRKQQEECSRTENPKHQSKVLRREKMGDISRSATYLQKLWWSIVRRAKMFYALAHLNEVHLLRLSMSGVSSSPHYIWDLPTFW